MSKLSIRPRTLDACKFIPIYKSEEIPDLNDYASINRSIPQLPTGMEKEEESEHHLQRAISAQQSKGTTGELVIPTPEVYDAPESFYNDLYPQSFKLPRQLIHVQPFAFENDIPDYDHDSEDEQWLESQKDIPNLTASKFEELIDCLDKNSCQNVIQFKEAKSLIKEDEDLIIAVYDYWLNKRLRLQTPLIPMVKTERRETTTNNSSNNNPYIAFRRRTEKMQTRKNRKNDEISYEKMIKLRRDLNRSLGLLHLVKQREERKREHVKMTVDIFEKRYLLGDFNGNIINEIQAKRQAAIRQASNSYLQSINNVLKPNENKPPRSKDADGSQPRKKREYRKRHRPEVVQRTEQEISEYTFTSDDEDINDNQSLAVSDQDEDDSDGPFAFKRKKGCQYYAPVSDPFGSWPEYSAEERLNSNNNNFNNKYCLTELKHNNKKFYEYTRRRIGRGGRIIFDRIQFNSPFNSPKDEEELDDNVDPSFDYFRPKSPSGSFKDLEDMDVDEDSVSDIYISSSVPIDLNSYLHENEDVYSDSRSHTDADLANFKNHQKELIEVQKIQKERLLMSTQRQQENSSHSSSCSELTQQLQQKSNLMNSLNHHHLSIVPSSSLNHINSEPLSEHTIKATVANINLLSSSTSMCNSNNKFSSNQSITNHNNSSSSSSDQNNATNSIVTSTPTTDILPQQHQTSPLKSSLDKESVSFAVSAVLSTANLPNSNSNLNTSTTTNNGPAQIEFNNNNNNNRLSGASTSSFSTSIEQYKFQQLSNQLSNQQTQQHSTSSSTVQQLVTHQPQWPNQQNSNTQQSNELTNSSNMFKVKFQTNNQNSIAPFTDVT